MSHDIDAIYDDGVFRPVEPLAIPNGERVHLRVVDKKGENGAAASAMPDEIARWRASIDEFRKVMAELPIESPDDGFSGADHDKLLYGKP
jgi:predicted DNA-binding antitoxin AbrB/MazE fold protein